MTDAEKLHRSKAPVSVGMLTMAVDVLTACVRKLLAERDLRIQVLEQKLAATVARRTMAFEGAFDPGRQYGAGDCVQRSGGLFVALAATSEQPGSSAQWRRIGEAK